MKMSNLGQMQKYKVINRETGYESGAMTLVLSLDLYDSLGGNAKGYAVVKAD